MGFLNFLFVIVFLKSLRNIYIYISYSLLATLVQGLGHNQQLCAILSRLFILIGKLYMVFYSITAIASDILVPRPTVSVCQRCLCLKALSLQSCLLDAVAEWRPAAQVALG